MRRFKNGVTCLVKFQRILSLFPSALATSVKLTLYQSSELLWLKMHLKPKNLIPWFVVSFPSSAWGVKSLAHPCLFYMWIPIGTDSSLTVILALRGQRPETSVSSGLEMVRLNVQLTPINSTFGKQRQENCCAFEVTLGYIIRSSLGYISKYKKQKLDLDHGLFKRMTFGSAVLPWGRGNGSWSSEVILIHCHAQHPGWSIFHFACISVCHAHKW